MSEPRNDRDVAMREARAKMVARLPRTLASAVVFFVVFTGIALAGHHSLGSALLIALILEAVFIVAIGLFVGVIVLIMNKTHPRR